MDIDFKYLDSLIASVETKKKSFKFVEIDETNAEITYLRQPLSLGFEVYKCGLAGEFHKQKHKIKEQSKLRSGSKHYLRIVNQNNQPVKIESFVHGKIDVVFLVCYENDKRYLFPFHATSGNYPTYTYVTRYMEGVVVEEYAVNSSQIVYEKYEKTEESKTQFSQVNYVPTGKCKVLSSEKGVFDHSSTITYSSMERQAWFDQPQP
ncbi:MAG: hypothetical protein LBE91_08515 [Tannerella sp.]|jgi:hypothetical protein|nr:hypothetical protein [Tannerella sp.]